MFQFVTESFETYMKRKLLSISHNRFDNFISAKYKGLLAYKIDKSSITLLDASKKMFLVTSSKDSKVSYRVDMEIGTCSCDIGKNGALCSHQAAVVLHYNIASVYFVPTLHPSLHHRTLQFWHLAIKLVKALIFILVCMKENYRFLTLKRHL